MRNLFLLPVLALGVTNVVGAQTTETMPNPLPATLSGNAFPFANTTTANAQHVQFIYDASHITSTAPVLIQKLRFHSTGACAGGSMTNVTIKLSQCPVAWNAVTTTFANNMIPAKTVTVLNDGTVNFNVTAAAGWCYDLVLTTPYLYDPAGGALVFDWERSATSTITGGFTGGMAGNATNPLKGSRVYGPAGQAVGAGFTASANGYACAAEITWIPAAGLYSSWTATPVKGDSPLTVQFTDTSYSSAGPIQTWAWDFNSDNTIDSTVQNPSYTFVATGYDQYFDVTLTTTDGTHPASKVTRQKFIRVNPSTATTVDFGAGSTNVPAPTPILVGPYQSTFASATAIRGFGFVAPSTLVVTGFEAPNDTTTTGTDQTIICYVLATPPTAAFTATAADVKFFATGPANSILRPTAPIIVQQGEWIGVLGAVHASAAASPLQNSYGAGPYATTVVGMPISVSRLWMNADPRVNMGLGTLNPNASGQIARVMVHVNGNFAVPTLTSSAAPVLGTTPVLDMKAVFTGAQVGILLLGAGRLPAPVPTPYGNLLILPPYPLVLTIPTGTGTVPLPIPNDANLTGITVDWQGAAFDLTNGVYGMTNGTEWFIGLGN